MLCSTAFSTNTLHFTILIVIGKGSGIGGRRGLPRWSG